MIDFKCPHCSNRLRVKDSAGGKTGKCKQCGKSITIPDTADEPQQDEEDEVEEAEEAIEDYLPLPKPRRPKNKIEKKSQNSGSSFPIIGAVVGGVCVLGLAVFFGILFSSGKLFPNADGGKPNAVPIVQNPPAATKLSAEEEARSKLKFCLDSWVFGDSDETFKQAHKGIAFFDFGYVIRDVVLLRYEIGISRPTSEMALDGKTKLEGYDFVVTLVLSAKNGSELKQGRRYSVRYLQRGDQGIWHVQGYKK